MLDDTIAAVVTPRGEGGVAIIRVSGKRAVSAVAAIFRSKTPLTEVPTHTIHYGHIVDDHGKRIEEVLVAVMRAPRSYTCEDVVEVNCHGGMVASTRVLQTILLQDVRIAQPGEFTKRAFLHGRIDLTQAEAVMDVIRARSERAHVISLKQLKGSLARCISPIRRNLLDTIAHVEVNIDYPEHDVAHVTYAMVVRCCTETVAQITQLLCTAKEGTVLREGLTTAIIGRPNVGKSSLLNALSQSNRAIVTDIPGTTRDVISENVTVASIPLTLLDTAGIREAADLVEQYGIERAQQVREEAQLVLLVLDRSQPLAANEKQWMLSLRDRAVVVVLNKADLVPQLDAQEIQQYLPDAPCVCVSLLHPPQGIAQLGTAIADVFALGAPATDDITVVSNVRQIHLLRQAKESILRAMEAVQQQMPPSLIQIDLHDAWQSLGEIIGDTNSEALLDHIFSQFCLGK